MSDHEIREAPSSTDQPRNLGELLARIAAVAAQRDRVCLATLIDAMGARAHGPVVLLIGIILFSPLSGIPGMPTLMGVALLLISLQILCGRGSLWLPGWLLRRSVPGSRLRRGVAWLDGPVARIDRFLRRRHLWLISGGGTVVVAILCLGLACLMPLMELLPFSATAAGLALLFFGLGMVAADGLLVLMGMIYLGAIVTLALAGLF